MTDSELLMLINAGMTDEEIVKHVHHNTKPADLYGAVAEVVTQALHGDPVLMQVLDSAPIESPVRPLLNLLHAIAEDEEYTSVAEWWRTLGIGRSDTKSIVMTYLYGSTEYGNRDSIQERIEKRADEILAAALDPYFDRSGADIYKDARTKAVTIMVKLIRGAMAVVCPSTVETMDLLQSWAETLGAQDRPFLVRTMMNFTFQQRNPNVKLARAEVYEGGKRVASLAYRVPVENGKMLNEHKMKAGAAPNAIHGNDACHLMMSTNACDSEFFMHIHDSMSTQCADTPNLAHAIRVSFCDMYADTDYLKDLYELNEGEKYGLQKPPAQGNLNVMDVMDSLYFFS